MPRVGQNPMRWVKGVHPPEAVTATTIVYIPHLAGYWEQSLDVLKMCLPSMRHSTRVPFDLMVFDNGSCREVQDFLIEEARTGNIQSLMLSDRNIGKAAAWNILLAAGPGQLISYADSDVLFLPGWLEATREVFNAFPKAGMVTCQPARRGLRFCQTTLHQAPQESDIAIATGDLISPEHIEACRRGLGRTVTEYQQITKGQVDISLTRGSVRAFVSADHFQFTTTRSVLNAVLPVNSAHLLGEHEYELDERVDSSGYWRLSTAEYLVHHMGNRLASEPAWPASVPTRPGHERATRTRNPLRRVARSPYVRGLLKGASAAIYRLLYD